MRADSHMQLTLMSWWPRPSGILAMWRTLVGGPRFRLSLAAFSWFLLRIKVRMKIKTFEHAHLKLCCPSGRSPPKAQKLTHVYLNLCSPEREKSFWSSQVDACAPEFVQRWAREIFLKLKSWRICTWICAALRGRSLSEAQMLTHAHLNLCSLESDLGEVLLKLRSWRMRTLICAPWNGRKRSEAYKLTPTHLWCLE